MTPSTIGRYQIKEQLGKGGMATVYRAYDPRTQRNVAVKVLPREFLDRETFRARFAREARIIAALEHPGIVPVYDFGEEDGQPYLVMRLMTGGTLADRLTVGPLSLDETSRILTRIAAALDEAHAQGVIHRDLKPANILFDNRNNPYLADFGIVKVIQEEGATLTLTGNILGTPAYMSPEQVQATNKVDWRSDIYSLGVILFEMLSGQIPFQADTPMGIALQHVVNTPPLLQERKPDLPTTCQAVIDKAMAKELDRRYQTAQELATAVTTAAKVKADQAIIFSTPPPALDTPAPTKVMASSPVKGKTEDTILATANLAPPQTRSRSRLLLPLIFIAILAVVGIAYFGFRPNGFFVAAATATPTLTLTPIPPAEIAVAATETVTPTTTPTPTQTTTPTPTATAVPTNTPSPEPTITPSPTLALPTDTPTPPPNQTISFANSTELVVLRTLQTAGPIYAISASPNGAMIAIAGDNGIKLYAGDTLDILGELPLVIGTNSQLSWSPDSNWLAIDSGSSLTIWPNNASSAALITLEAETGKTRLLNWSSDSRLLVSGNQDGQIQLWTSDDWQADPILLAGHRERITALAWSLGNTALASGSQDNTVRIWSPVTAAQLQLLTGHSSDVADISWSPDGQILATRSTGDVLLAWDTFTGDQLRRFTNVPHAFWFPQDSSRLALVQGTGIEIRATADWSKQNTWSGHGTTMQQSIWSPDGDLLATAGLSPAVQIWNAAGDLVGTVTLNTAVAHLFWSPDGSQLIAYDETNLHLWNSAGGTTQEIGGHDGLRTAFLTAANNLVSVGRGDNLIRLWDRQTAQQVNIIADYGARVGYASEIRVIRWSPDGDNLAALYGDGTVRIWQGAAGRPIQALYGHAPQETLVNLLSLIEDVQDFAWSPDARTIVTAGSDKMLRVWDVATGSTLHILGGFNEPIRAVSWSPDGAHIVAVSNSTATPVNTGGRVRLWDGETFTEITSFRNSINDVVAVTWSPDSAEFAIGGVLGSSISVEIRSVDGQQLDVLGNHSPAGIYDLVWSPDGELLATAGRQDNTIRLWDATDWGLITQEVSRVLNAHRNGTLTLTWSPNNQLLASLGGDGVLKVWQRDDNAEFTEVAAYEGFVSSEYTYGNKRIGAAFAPDGKAIAVVTADNTIQILGIRP